MSFGLAFWVLMFLWLFFSFAWNRGCVDSTYGFWGNSLLLFVLFLLLGWRVFGAPLHP